MELIKQTKTKRRCRFLPSITLMTLLLMLTFGICNVENARAKETLLTKNENVAGISDANQTKKMLRGVVTDETGEPLPGAFITIEGSTRGVSTDIDGRYSIEVSNSETIVVSFIGFENQTIAIGARTVIDVALKEKTNELDEVTVVAFAKQKKESVVASITTVRPSELKVPSSNLTTALAGRIAGLISYQRTGEPGLDNAEFFIRGITTFGTGKADPLILIDGVEMTNDDLARLTTDDIASFSIMKDANATALYGARGANGVVLVTTKEGTDGNARVQFRMESSYSAPTETVQLADPLTYMRLHNEAVRTRFPMAQLPYGNAKIVNTERGIDPVRYPATDWFGMLFDDHTFNQRYNLNVSGGGKVARYYIAASYAKDNGIIKVDKRNNFNSNIDIDKYVLRANVNVNLTSSTEAIVRLHGAFDDYSGPLDGGTELYKKAMNANPVYFPPYYEPDAANVATNHILFGNINPTYLNPYAEMVKGYKSSDRSNMLAQFELKQDLSFITEGLTARGLFNVNRYSLLEMRNAYKPFFYSLNTLFNEYSLTPLNPDGTNGGTDFLDILSNDKTITSSMYFEGALQYGREFAKKHSVSALLVYTLRESLNGNAESIQKALPHRNLGLAGRLTYSYDSRYFFETNFGYNGSERFAENERFGFFPSVGGGWIVSNESFMTPLSSVISKLKLKATYGLVGNDAIGDDSDRFFYLSELNMSNNDKGASFGSEYNYTRPGISISRYADNQITWEISRKTNLGLELNLWNNLEIQVDYSLENRSKILQKRIDIPKTMGLQAEPRSNVGKASGRALEFSVDYSKSFSKDFWVMGRGNFTYASSQYDLYDEPDYADTPWRLHSGRKISQQYGYIAERLFLDENEVQNSPPQMFGPYGAGDIKYRDINGDMQIDENDQVPIGYPTTPEIIYGFGISTGYKNIDFSCFFQGSGRSSFWIDAEQTAPFINRLDKAIDTDGKDKLLWDFTTNRAMLQYWADSHWSEGDRNVYALWPRLSETRYQNNLQKSTWFMRDGTFLRLKTLEIGYTLPKRWVSAVKLKSARVYLSGNNLLVFSNFKMWDPEMAGNGLAYPVQRVYNIGVNVEF